jgi:hypothetical protein
LCFEKFQTLDLYIYVGVLLDALIPDPKTPSRAATRSSLRLLPKFVMYSLRSGEGSAMVSGHLRQTPCKPSPLQGSSRSPLRCHAFLFVNPSSLDCFPCPLFLSLANFTIASPLFSVSGHVRPRPSPSSSWPWCRCPSPPAPHAPSSRCVARAALQPCVLHGCASPAPPRVGPCPPPCLVPRVGLHLALAGRPVEPPWPWREPRPFPVHGAAATYGDGGHDVCTEPKVEDEVITMLPPAVI